MEAPEPNPEAISESADLLELELAIAERNEPAAIELVANELREIVALEPEAGATRLGTLAEPFLNAVVEAKSAGDDACPKWIHAAGGALINAQLRLKEADLKACIAEEHIAAYEAESGKEVSAGDRAKAHEHFAQIQVKSPKRTLREVLGPRRRSPRGSEARRQARPRERRPHGAPRRRRSRRTSSRSASRSDPGPGSDEPPGGRHHIRRRRYWRGWL